MVRKAAGPEVLSKQTRRMQGTCREQDGPSVEHAAIRESHAHYATRIVVRSHEFDSRDAGQQLEIRQAAQLRKECGLGIGFEAGDRCKSVEPARFERMLENRFRQSERQALAT